MLYHWIIGSWRSEDALFPRNVGDQQPRNTASHHSRSESSPTLLCKPHISEQYQISSVWLRENLQSILTHRTSVSEKLPALMAIRLFCKVDCTLRLQIASLSWVAKRLKPVIFKPWIYRKNVGTFMDCWNNVKPLDFRCHSVIMAVSNRNFSWQRQEGLLGAHIKTYLQIFGGHTETYLQIVGGQTLKQFCRLLVEKYEWKWQVASRGYTFGDSDVFWRRG